MKKQRQTRPRKIIFVGAVCIWLGLMVIFASRHFQVNKARAELAQPGGASDENLSNIFSSLFSLVGAGMILAVIGLLIVLFGVVRVIANGGGEGG